MFGFNYLLRNIGSFIMLSTGYYLGQMAFLLVTSGVILLCVYHIKKRKLYITKKLGVLVIFLLIYMIALSNIKLGYVAHMKMNPWIWDILSFFCFLTCGMLPFIIYRKNMQREKLAQISRLSYIRVQERRQYKELCRRVEQMAKLRHDFYGQLEAARWVIAQENEKGMELLAEIKEELSSGETAEQDRVLG